MPKRAMRTSVFADIVARFGANVTPKLRAAAGHGEAQLRDPFASLLKEAGAAIGLEVLTIDETPLDALGVRPDFMVNVAGAKVGFVELKARGRKVPTTWTPTTREQEQWDKLRLLPNVLYSDGEQYAVYHFGVLSGLVAQLDGDLRTAGSALRPVDGQFERVITEFLLWEPDPPRSVGQLVHAVANLCRLLRDEVRTTLHREQRGEESQPIFSSLAADWREYLFPDLLDADFADAYAQTVTFALLLARADGISFEANELPEIARRLGKTALADGQGSRSYSPNGQWSGAASRSARCCAWSARSTGTTCTSGTLTSTCACTSTSSKSMTPNSGDAADLITHRTR